MIDSIINQATVIEILASFLYFRPRLAPRRKFNSSSILLCLFLQNSSVVPFFVYFTPILSVCFYFDRFCLWLSEAFWEWNASGFEWTTPRVVFRPLEGLRKVTGFRQRPIRETPNSLFDASERSVKVAFSRLKWNWAEPMATEATSYYPVERTLLCFLSGAWNGRLVSRRIWFASSTRHPWIGRLLAGHRHNSVMTLRRRSIRATGTMEHVALNETSRQKKTSIGKMFVSRSACVCIWPQGPGRLLYTHSPRPHDFTDARCSIRMSLRFSCLASRSKTTKMANAKNMNSNPCARNRSSIKSVRIFHQILSLK